MTPGRLVAGYLVVLVVTTAVTWQIVGIADSQVGAQPVELATVSPVGVSTSTSVASTSTSSPVTTTSTSSPVTTTPGASSSTSEDATSNTSEWSYRTVTTAGGSVVVRHRPGQVEFQAATPTPGFDVEVDEMGPDRVRVEFESAVTDIRVELRWEDGILDVDISA
ncbi:MAG: hypothetical protein ACRDU9_04510 [Acidimicrobiia bacterium]